MFDVLTAGETHYKTLMPSTVSHLHIHWLLALCAEFAVRSVPVTHLTVLVFNPHALIDSSANCPQLVPNSTQFDCELWDKGCCTAVAVCSQFKELSQKTGIQSWTSAPQGWILLFLHYKLLLLLQTSTSSIKTIVNLCFPNVFTNPES